MHEKNYAMIILNSKYLAIILRLALLVVISLVFCFQLKLMPELLVRNDYNNEGISGNMMEKLDETLNFSNLTIIITK